MADEPIIDESRLRAAEELAQSEEGPRRQLSGPVGLFVSAAAVAMSLLFLYWAWASVTAQILRLVFLGFALVLSFLLYPGRRINKLERIPWSDWLLAGAAFSRSDTLFGISKISSTAPPCRRRPTRSSGR